ncbi:MAG: DUF2851 family protein [Candidatus Hydrogenedentes bacterium]|nr:DUF2851 family protein [Candidatus Hydrogenedentota bacterium]
MDKQFLADGYLEALAWRDGLTPRAAEAVPERVVQQLWYDRTRNAGLLSTLEGHQLEVVSPGWWNFCAGPDFQGAQLRFNGTLFKGDVEVHLDQAAWRHHGHDRDPRYNNVLLHVLLNSPPNPMPVLTHSGRALPHFVLKSLPSVEESVGQLFDVEEHPELAPRAHGSCNRFFAQGAPEALTGFLPLAGDWRMLNKARRMEEQIAAVGPDQAAYEAIFGALGYRNFTVPFQRLARALPYERAAQLSRQEPHLLEAALLHLSGLLPDQSTGEAKAVPHLERLHALRAEHLTTLRSLPLEWPLAGVRPNNYPSRRIAGAAGLIGRVARDGLVSSLERLWREHAGPTALRKAFEGIFPRPLGFWSRHYRFDGPTLAKATAVVGTGRVRSIIGNIFVPLALARARMAGDQSWEEQIFTFYRALPLEPDNHVYQRMAPRVLGDTKLRLNFRLQQGLLQMHEDWCRNNPSCRDCALLAYLERGARASIT